MTSTITLLSMMSFNGSLLGYSRHSDTFAVGQRWVVNKLFKIFNLKTTLESIQFQKDLLLHLEKLNVLYVPQVFPTIDNLYVLDIEIKFIMDHFYLFVKELIYHLMKIIL